MRGQVRSQLCFIANRFKSPVAQGTGDVRVDVPWVLTRVPTFPPLLTQITESNNHLCGMCIRLCVGRKKGEATSLRNERPTVLRTPSPDAFCFQGADFSRHPSHTCPSPFTYLLPKTASWNLCHSTLPGWDWGGKRGRRRKWGSHVRNLCFPDHESVSWWCFQYLKDRQWFFFFFFKKDQRNYLF